MDATELKALAKALTLQKSGVHELLRKLIIDGFFDVPKSTDDIIIEIRHSSGRRVKSNVMQTYMKKFMEKGIIRSSMKSQSRGNLWVLASEASANHPSKTIQFNGSKTRILFLAANPLGTSQLALDRESREIEDRIRASKHRNCLELVTKWAVRPNDLLQYLNEHDAHAVHFSGHGSSSEEIILADADGTSKPVGKAALKQLFLTLKGNIRLVMLNACFSQAQAEAIVEVVDCAIGMNKSIGDKAAIVFAAAFYQAIGFGHSVKTAFESGKAALMLEGIAEEQTPELLVRKGINAGAIFLLNTAEATSRR